eukprot:2870801-Pyramimonas_sp.AAC.1
MGPALHGLQQSGAGGALQLLRVLPSSPKRPAGSGWASSWRVSCLMGQIPPTATICRTGEKGGRG